MIAKLLVIAGPDRGRSFEIVPKVPTVVGSSREADVMLNDARVSPFHCRIEVRAGQLPVDVLTRPPVRCRRGSSPVRWA